MRFSIIVKLVILFVALALVIWASFVVREGSLEGIFVSLGGVDTSKQINICSNRIHALTFSDRKRIEESKSGSDLQWIAFDPSPRVLNYLQIEKWLGEHCYINASELKEKMESLGPFEPALKIEFIDKSEATLMQNSAKKDIYSWSGRLYQSPEMTGSLTELRALGGW